MQFGPFTIERAVENYGPVVVYTAQHNDQRLLLTVYSPDSAEAALRWSARIKAVAGLHHPGLTPFIKGGTSEGKPYVVTRLQAPVLSQAIVLSPARALDVSSQITAALDYAHSQGIYHGRLRAAHVVSAGADQYALRGFELAGALPAGVRLTRAADISALGQFFHRALVGLPLEGADVSPLLPVPLDGVLRKTLPGDSAFETAGAFHAAFAQAVQTLSPEQLSQPLVSARPRPTSRPERGNLGWLLLPLIMLVIAFGAAAYLLINRAKPDSLALPTSAVTQRATPIPPSPTVIAAEPASPAPVALELFKESPTVILTDTPTDVAPTQTAPPTVEPTQPGIITATPMIVLSDTPSLTPSETPIPPTAPPGTATPVPAPPKPCISMVGDSVTHGGVTYEVPDSGYIVGLTHPLAEFVNLELRGEGINTLIAYDRGASNTGINSSNHASYFKSPAYSELLNDHCKFTVIMPWFNDITPGNVSQTDAAPQHVRALIALIKILTEVNPAGRVILLNYYQGAVAPFAASTWANGFTPNSRALYNQEIEASCNAGSLSKLDQVTCLNSDDAFQGMGNGYVIGLISREQLSQNLVAPLNDIQQSWLDQYFATNPDGLLQGDGIHLSTPGKKAMAAFIVKATQSLPDLPVPAPADANN